MFSAAGLGCNFSLPKQFGLPRRELRGGDGHDEAGGGDGRVVRHRDDARDLLPDAVRCRAAEQLRLQRSHLPRVSLCVHVCVWTRVRVLACRFGGGSTKPEINVSC